ncbi:hypothetical protein QFC24_007054 [Naganishia onofrii]|uniref:Uncharacterized protein n=1 Tax=Naganishia onofrii TaxID=1851511 RepID=A0ACC2WWI5_9TREE|nr:hypothetical protein QFC24_007054 [Naganishia onofrii]
MSLASIATTPQPLSYGTFPGSLASHGVLSLDGTSTRSTSPDHQRSGSDAESNDGVLCNCLEPIFVRSTVANPEARPPVPKKKGGDIRLDVRFFDTVSDIGENGSTDRKVQSDDDDRSGFGDSCNPQLKVADEDGQPAKPDEGTGKEDDSDSLQSFETAPEGNDDQKPLLP